MARTDSSSLVVSPASLLPSSSSSPSASWRMSKSPSSTSQDTKERARCEWDFHLCSIVSQASTREVSDAIGAIEFDPKDQFLATAGIARKIRLYPLQSLLQKNSKILTLDHSEACSFYICAPAKLSSLKWKPNCFALGAGDYDGVVTEYDLERKVPVFERDEHGGRRVWSIDYSLWMDKLGGSASDDGSAQLWDTRCGGAAAAALRPGGGDEPSPPVCSIEFDPFGGALIGLGCADKKAYVYDMRRLGNPVTIFGGHERTVTYVRFAGGGERMVSAGTDGCIRMWGVADGREIRVFEGHRNRRSFVGLSVWSGGGLLASGSETNQVYVYDSRWGDPIWVGWFDHGDDDGGFVSSVCWRHAAGGEDDDACTVVAGASNGVLQVFGGRKKKNSFIV